MQLNNITGAMVDNETNVVFKYFWVNKFKWLIPEENERTGGHPKEGTLYQGWINADTNTYRLYYKAGNAIWLEKLKSSESDMLPYIADIREVNVDTILDLPISEKDLDSLSGWLETDNKNLKDRLFKESVPVPIMKLIEEGVKKMDAYEKEIDEFCGESEELFELDKPTFEQVRNVIRYSLDSIYEKKTGPLDGDYLSLDETRAGLGFNIGKAQELIYQYASTDRRTNEDPVDLLEAIYHLLTELKRREHHNLNK
jgi:hypothetical protein